jgi:hypothetical protein
MREWVTVSALPNVRTRQPFRVENSIDAAKKDIEEMFLDPRAEAAFRTSQFSSMGIEFYKHMLVPQAMIARMAIENGRNQTMIRVTRRRRWANTILFVLFVAVMIAEWRKDWALWPFRGLGSTPAEQHSRAPNK